MTLQAPAWLALLLLAAPILLLHMRRRRRMQVSSLLLWAALSSERRPSVSLQRPPLSSALFLQLLALLLVSLLLARPVLGGGPGSDHLLLLVDAGWQQRQDERRAATLDEVRRALELQAQRPGALVSVIAVGERPRPVAARWLAEEAAMADLLPGLGTTDAAPDWQAAALSARPLLEADESSRVLLIGAQAEVRREVAALLAADDTAGEALTVEAVTPTARPAVAIVSARVVAAEEPGAWRLTGRVAAVDHPGGTARLRLDYATDQPGAERSTTLEVSLAPGPDDLLTGEFEAQVLLEAPGVLTLTPEQAGPPATFVLQPSADSFSVLYVGPGNPALERAFGALSHVEYRMLTVPTGSAPLQLPADGEEHDLVVVDRVRLQADPRTSTLWLGGAAPGGSVAQPLEDLQVTAWDAEHPLSARTDWGALPPLAAWHAPLLPGARTLLSGEGAPLLQIRRLEHGSQVLLSFDPVASGWSATPAFPLFVRDLALLIAPAGDARVAAACHVGRDCALPAGVTELVDPEGRPVPLPLAVYGDVSVSADSFAPSLAGAYSYVAGGNQGWLAVNSFLRPAPQGGAVEPAAGARTWPTLRLLLLVAVALVLALEAWLSRGRYEPPFRGAKWLLRGAALTLVVAAAFGPRLPLPTSGGRLLVVAPAATWASGEVPGWQETAQGLAELAEAEADSLVVTHADADLQGAAELALAHALPGEPTTLLLIGDGAEARGNLGAALARTAGRAGGVKAPATVSALPQGRAPAGEATLRSLSAPALIAAGDRFPLRVEVHASSAVTATLRTFREQELVDERRVELAPGSNSFEVVVHEPEPGAARYRAELELPGDTFAENNAAHADLTVLPAGRVLLVAADPAWGAVSAAAWSGQGIDTVFAQPAAMPAGDGLLAYDAIVLANAPATAFSGAQLAALESAVQDHGRALLLLGGERAFGPGGYLETPLERLSPASSLVPREAPEMALAFVIDRSNSMRQYAGDEVRLEIAKVAVMRAFELLPEGARASLIAFDSIARTLVPLVSVEETALFQDAVAALEPRGGTAIYPGLLEAHAQLAESGAAAKHVIVMSDGLSQPGDFAGILAELASAGVTVSTIGIGPEADAAQLREIATLGGGSFHFSADFSALPGIMAHEVLLQSGELTEEGATAPTWHDRAAPFLQAWPTELPPVAGFVPTSLKPGARLHLAVTDEEGREVPLLASWRYGAGEVVAFTAHAAGPWTLDWLQLAEYPLLWSHLLRQLAAPPVDDGPSLSGSLRGDRLRVEWLASDGSQPPELMLERPDGRTVPLQLHWVGAGRYVAEAVAAEPGTYTVSPTSTAVAPSEAVRFHRSYPASLDFGLADEERLAATVLGAGGTVLASLAEATAPSALYWRPAPAWPWLALAGLALMLLELTMRYAPELLLARRKG